MNKNFKTKKISRSAAIQLNDKIENVFPLFGAFEERKWANGWNPELIYPDTEIIEEGTTFKTNARFEKENLWIVTKFEKNNHLIQYLVQAKDRFWTITVQCLAQTENTTKAIISYSFIGLNELGNKLNKEHLEEMYSENLKDWEKKINQYLDDSKKQNNK